MPIIKEASIPIVTGIGRDRSLLETIQHLHTEYSTPKIAVVGCATGEQPFSIAQLLNDQNIRIDGYDIDQESIRKAASGIISSRIQAEDDQDYALEILQPMQRAGKLIDETSFQVEDRLRQMTRFSVHNILHEPLPSPYDLVVCSHLLYYFAMRALQTTRSNLDDALYNISQSLFSTGMLVTDRFPSLDHTYENPKDFRAIYRAKMLRNPYFTYVPELSVPSYQEVGNQKLLLERAHVFTKKN